MSTTPHLSLPIIDNQARAARDTNSALRLLDALIQLSVKDRDLAAPPASPAMGDRYLIAASPTGAWMGKEGAVTVYVGSWVFFTPEEGWHVWVDDENITIAFDGTTWTSTAVDLSNLNASNLTSGTVPAEALPAPTSTTFGGVKSLAATSHKFLTSIGTDGIPVAAQPAASDITGLAASATTDTTNAANISSGVLDVARIPVLPSQTVIVSSGDLTALTSPQQAQISTGVVVTTTDGNRWVYSGSGSKTLEASYVQLADITPDWTAISGKPSFATSATTDTTNASNISSGTLAAARGGAGTISGLLKANGSGVVSAATAGTDYLTPSGSGASLTSLNATNLSSGTVADARLSANVPLKNATVSITGAYTFNANLSFGSGFGFIGAWSFSINEYWLAFNSGNYRGGFTFDPNNRLLTIYAADADGTDRNNIEIKTGGSTGTLAAYIKANGTFGFQKNITLEEVASTPADPTSGTQTRIYMKGDKVVFQFNDAGTVRYKYLDMTGTGVTWVHSTTAP